MKTRGKRIFFGPSIFPSFRDAAATENTYPEVACSSLPKNWEVERVVLRAEGHVGGSTNRTLESLRDLDREPGPVLRAQLLHDFLHLILRGGFDPCL